jgi:transcriptional regulator of acetoin/glycerol metabolism
MAARHLSMEEITRDHLMALLKRTGGNLREIAKQMCVARSTVYRKVRHHHLNPGDFRVHSRP